MSDICILKIQFRLKIHSVDLDRDARDREDELGDVYSMIYKEEKHQNKILLIYRFLGGGGQVNCFKLFLGSGSGGEDGWGLK